MAHFEALESGVDPAGPIQPDDIRQTKQALHDLGFYQMPAHGITDFTDDEMFEGIAAFQRARKLRVDGTMIPDGQTERAINNELAKRDQQREERASAGGAPKPAAASGSIGFGLLRPPFSGGRGQFGGAIPASFETDDNNGSNQTRNTQVAKHETPIFEKLYDRVFGPGDSGRKEKDEPHKPADSKPSPVQIPKPPDPKHPSCEAPRLQYLRSFTGQGFWSGR